ncbi:heat shock protein beta-7 isoform X1 [Nothobranchius furzeri]|uniref:Heat shock protein beta-7-like n=1 Tax=Nothobranchius furzeri TaxID=105023 RepID=A0A9D2XTE0_NOTFU|nr:heat shock protein beta-7 isoform X1 [Nothobranchius furzeri]KAF7207930.1 heat shock protein beta-7-like [Nothobranchius furzeri]
MLTLVCMEEGQRNCSEDSGCSPLPGTEEHKFTGHSSPTGKIQVIGDIFQFTLDVSEFSPEEVIVITSNNLLEVQADKVGEGGTVTKALSHKCKLPSNVDPFSVSTSMSSSGVLIVKAQKM